MGIIKTHLLHLVRTCGSVERWRKNFKTDRFLVVFGFLTTTHHKFLTKSKRHRRKKWEPQSPSSNPHSRSRTMIVLPAAALHLPATDLPSLLCFAAAHAAAPEIKRQQPSIITTPSLVMIAAASILRRGRWMRTILRRKLQASSR